MNRILLTLLALLTGLSASGGSAEARTCAVSETEIGVLAVLVAKDCAADVAGQKAELLSLTPKTQPGLVVPTAHSMAAHTETVLIGIDRARE